VDRVNIVGLGPRGLAVALHALRRGLEVRAYDPNPLGGWKSNNIPDLMMRSPITFDLATYLEADYTLANYLQVSTVDTTTATQEEIEAEVRRCDRATFEGYLSHCLNRALKAGLQIVPEKLTIVNGAEPTVIATGDRLGFRLPTWLTNNIRAKPLTYFIQAEMRSQRILVIGSGQGAAEAVAYLSENNRVTWSSKFHRVDEYPAPSYKHWKGLSALGHYYRGLTSMSTRLRYLKRVKEWGPSITPYIVNVLSQRDYTLIPVITCSSDLPEVDYICVATGYKPILGVEVSYQAYLPNVPLVSEGFSINNNVYVTGPSALYYDGPRQNSLISAGSTAREIIDHITSNYYVYHRDN
jgi:FAD-NAD(P)-binding